ncbi:MAG: hypothetical protein U1E78_08205 [Gammaproteobacteria bacterium]
MSWQQVDFLSLILSIQDQYPNLNFQWLSKRSSQIKRPIFPYFGPYHPSLPPNIALFDSTIAPRPENLPERVSVAIFCECCHEIPNYPDRILLRTSSTLQEIYETLYPTVQMACSPQVIQHGTFLSIFDKGVLLVGESGTGKSMAALHLIEKGHRLICDDAPQLTRIQPHKIVASCPSNIYGLLEVRGLGIWQIPRLFGNVSVQPRKNLDLVIRLIKPNTMTTTPDHKLKPRYQTLKLLNVDIPEIMIETLPGQYLASQIEVAVRGWIDHSAASTTPTPLPQTTGAVLCDF